MILSWFPVFLWMGLIFYVSGIPALSTGWGIWDLILRKLAHMTEYGILTVLLMRAWRRTIPALNPKGVFAFSAIIAILYAVSDEYHQSFVPGRAGSPRDVLIDSCGIMLAILIIRQRTKTT